jgi:hypothetical protein
MVIPTAHACIHEASPALTARTDPLPVDFAQLQILSELRTRQRSTSFSSFLK